MSRKQRIGVLCLALCLALFCSACGAPQSQTGEAQMSASLTPAPTETEETPQTSAAPSQAQTAQPTQKQAKNDKENGGANGSGGVIVSKTIELEKGATVYDALKKVCPDAKEQGGYVYKIGQLSEQDMGKLSGWMYSINGTYVQVGCKQKTLSDGDVVRWRYTCDGGADIGGAA